MNNIFDNIETPVRIAHIAGKLACGGVESVIFNYYRAIDKSKIQFDIYYDADSVYEPPEDLIEMGARFIKIPPYQKIWKYIPTLTKKLRKENYRIIHSHLNTLSVFPLFAAFCAGIPVRIAHNHSVPAGNEKARNLLKNFLRLFSRVFATHYAACSEMAGKWLFGESLFNHKKIKIINNAVDFKKFSVSENRRIFLEEKFSLENKFVVGHVGRFTYAKNHDRLIDIFRTLKKVSPDTVLLLVGDGELREKITEKLMSLDLSDSVIMVGSVSDPEVYYSLMDVMVYPSFFEGLPMACVEAQIMKVPVIATEAVPEAAIISNGLTYLQLSSSDEEWVDVLSSVSKEKMMLTANAEKYNIVSAVKELEQWYACLYRMR